MGDDVLIYFGYPEAHEDDAERAVRAGLEAIVAVGALKLSVPLETRIGIAKGALALPCRCTRPRGMEGIKFPTALALLLRADLSGARQRPSNHRLKLRLAGNLATDVANEVAEPCAQEAQLPLVALEPFGMCIAAGHHGRLTMRLWVTRRFGIKSTRGALCALRRRTLARA